MELIFALPSLILPVSLPFMAKMIARDMGRNPKFWFWISIPFPLVAHFILLSLPNLSKRKCQQTSGVEE